MAWGLGVVSLKHIACAHFRAEGRRINVASHFIPPLRFRTVSSAPLQFHPWTQPLFLSNAHFAPRGGACGSEMKKKGDVCMSPTHLRTAPAESSECREALGRQRAASTASPGLSSPARLPAFPAPRRMVALACSPRPSPLRASLFSASCRESASPAPWSVSVGATAFTTCRVQCWGGERRRGRGRS